MSGNFDPYFALLEIVPESGPMTFYRLLGIGRFESDSVVINGAADQRREQLRQVASGPHRQHTLKLLKQVETARRCLTNEVSRNEYETKLRALLAKGSGRPSAKHSAGKKSPQRQSASSARASTRSKPESPTAQQRRRVAGEKRKAASRKYMVIGGILFGTVGLLAAFVVPGLLASTEEPSRLQTDQLSQVAAAAPSTGGEPAAAAKTTPKEPKQPSNIGRSSSPPATIAAADGSANDETQQVDSPTSTPAMAEPTEELTSSEPAQEPTEPGLAMAKTSEQSPHQSTINKVFAQKTGRFLDQHCIRCHGPKREEGGLRIDQLTASLDDLESIDHYQNILDEITVAAMPPKDEPQPDSADITAVVEALTSHLDAAKRKHESGGGKSVRRLAKIEYANTVYDLMGVHIDAELLQNDGGPGAFDTQADALYTTDMYFENYLDAARNAVRRFIASRASKPGRFEIARKGPKTPRRRKAKQPRTQLPGKQADKLPGKGIPPAGHLIAAFTCWDESPTPGKPPVVSTPSGDRFEVVGTKKAPYVVERTFYQPMLEVWRGPPRVHMGFVTLTQVVNPQPYSFFAEYRKKFGGRNNIPNSVGKQIITQFAELMSRGRKVEPKLLAGLNQLFLAERQEGRPFWEALVEPMALSMCTLEAMFHFEDKDFYADKGSVSPIDQAGRLSYFLWRSAPDPELIRLAHSGKLMDPAVRSQQVERMMNDERFNRFLADFSNQWLELERQDLIAVDEDLFRDFDVAIKRSMKEETIQFMSHVINENLPLDNLIDSDFVFINSAMARHYGIPGIKGDGFRKVSLPRNTQRGGLLTQAGILMQTGTGDRSSIVERGVFIAKKMMDAEPAPPPPLVDDLPTSGRDFERMSGAELVRRHARLPQCASCHKKIDPMGLGLEEFDAIGLYRDRDVRLVPGYGSLSKKAKRRTKKRTFAVPLETRGNLVTGQKFQGVNGLKKALMRNKPRLAQSYVKGLLTFANGRKFGVADQAILDDVMKQAASDNYPARTLVKAVVESSAFTSN